MLTSQNPTSKTQLRLGSELSHAFDCDCHTQFQRLVGIFSVQAELTQRNENSGGGNKCEALHGTSHFCLEYQAVGGIVFPTHRRVFGRDPKQEEPDRSAPPAVEVTISDIQIRLKASQWKLFKTKEENK